MSVSLVVKFNPLFPTALFFLGLVVPLRGQLVAVSIQTDATFQDDAVGTPFNILDGSPATINFEYNAQNSQGIFWQVIITNSGEDLVNQTRPLDGISLDGNELVLTYQRLVDTGPFRDFLLENLDLPIVVSGVLSAAPGDLPNAPFVVDGFGQPFGIPHDNTQLFASGDSPIIGSPPPGFGGFFIFGEFSGITSYSVELVPTPEPTTYGLGALLLIGLVVGFRRLGLGRSASAA